LEGDAEGATRIEEVDLYVPFKVVFKTFVIPYLM
jgi:hypothetical protein